MTRQELTPATCRGVRPSSRMHHSRTILQVRARVQDMDASMVMMSLQDDPDAATFYAQAAAMGCASAAGAEIPIASEASHFSPARAKAPRKHVRLGTSTLWESAFHIPAQSGSRSLYRH